MYIAIEGIDGSGKTTVARLLAAGLNQHSLIGSSGDALWSGEAMLVSEPGGTPEAQAIREIFKNPDFNVHPMTELYLLSAARSSLIRDKITPALDEKKLVITDRCFATTLAYQGQDLPEVLIMDTTIKATNGVFPDYIYIIDVDYETAIARRIDRGDTPDRIERKGEQYQQKAMLNYRSMGNNNPKRYRLIDGSGTPIEIVQRIVADLKKLLGA